MVTARDREAWNSQKLAVLEHLQAGRSITQDEAREQFGIMRLASRIDELKALPQWVVWQAVERNGKITKPPRQIALRGRPCAAGHAAVLDGWGRGSRPATL